MTQNKKKKEEKPVPNVEKKKECTKEEVVHLVLSSGGLSLEKAVSEAKKLKEIKNPDKRWKRAFHKYATVYPMVKL